MKINYCIVGTGSRAVEMFAKDLIDVYQDVAALTGLCDVNPGRLEWAKKTLGMDIPSFINFDDMLDQVACDVVIVTTIDALHDAFIIRAMERGKDVITEKPMTIDEKKCRAILKAEKETGRQIKVTFNCRYAPFKAKVKELLQNGIVGDIHSVEFRWFLDTVHGADYFRRWHRFKKNSGGLLVHKSTHHFDMLNWWIDKEPIEVAAMGSRHFYVHKRKPNHGERCFTCKVTDSCEFYMDLSKSDSLKEPYLDNERFDGYYRDQCVFSNDTDIEDTMSVIVRYSDDIQLTYGLTAATSFEGWQVAINGSKGRLEAFEPEAFISEKDQILYETRVSSTVRRQLDWRSPKMEENNETLSNQICFYPLFGGVETFDVPYVSGGHGGADRRLKDDLFRNNQTEDPLGQRAGTWSGAMSLLIGSAANKSINEKRFITIEELLRE